MLLPEYIAIYYLSQRYPEVYAEIGEPKFMDSNLGQSAWSLQTFIWRFRFLKLKDIKLTVLCLISMVLELLFLVYFFNLL
jgi:hypothetical protein